MAVGTYASMPVLPPARCFSGMPPASSAADASSAAKGAASAAAKAKTPGPVVPEKPSQSKPAPAAVEVTATFAYLRSGLRALPVLQNVLLSTTGIVHVLLFGSSVP